MVAGEAACTCAVCEVVCAGKFGGCADVWARSPQPVRIVHSHELEPAEMTALEPPPDETPDDREEEAPPAVTNPAAEIVTWLRAEFDGVHDRLRGLSERLARQEAAVRTATEARAEELGISLAELESCAGRLRSEATGLGELRAELAESMPQLASEAVAPALAETAARAVAEVRGAVAELGAALAEALPPAVAHAVSIPAAPVAAPPASMPNASGDTDLVSQLHEAQDEAAEWFTIVVDEAVRRAVERHLAPIAAALAAPSVGGASPAAAAGAGSPAPRGAGSEVPAPGAPLTEPVGDLSTGADAKGVAVEGSAPSGPGSEAAGPVGSGEATQGTATTSDRDLRAAGQAGPRPTVETLVADLGLAPSSVAPVERAPAFTTRQATNGAPSAAERTEQQETPTWGGDDGSPAEPEPDSSVACVLPGAAVGPTLALGVSSALRRARLRRRSRRPAGAPAAGLHRHDPFAGELSLRLERFALARRNLAFDANGADPPDRATAMVAAAELDEREVALDLAEGPVALVGPGAADAGRALVTTFLARYEPASGRVIAVADALPPGSTLPGLQRRDEMAAAVDELEAELDRRAALLAGSGTTGLAEPTLPPLPLLLLVTPTVPESVAPRLARLLARGPALGLTAVGVGCELDGAATVTLQPGAVTRSVMPEGRAHDLWGARLFTLDAGAAAELLEVLSASRTDESVATGEVEEQPFTVLTPAGTAPIQVRLLGTYRLEVDGQEIKSGLRAKARELLAFYLLHTEGTTLDVATQALWPEADTGRGSEWFWTALGNLRTTLRRATGTKALMVIERDGDRYRIEPVFDVDLWRFQDALPPSAAADTGDPAWTTALEAAAGLYGGELLADVDWAWVEVPRDDLRRRSVDVLVALAAIRQRAGDVHAALDTLLRAVEVDPVAEQLYRRIMRLQANQSEPEEVAATFRRLQAKLDDLDLEPTAESSRLAGELSGTA